MRVELGRRKGGRKERGWPEKEKFVRSCAAVALSGGVSEGRSSGLGRLDGRCQEGCWRETWERDGVGGEASEGLDERSQTLQTL
jgi:hypothetical protein